MKRIIYIAAIAACAISASAQISRFPNPTIKIEHDESQGTVTSYLVSANGSNRMTRSTIELNNDAGAVDGTITLNTSDIRQEIDGFGFAITSTVGYNMLKMNADQRRSLITQIFSRDHGYGCSYVRVPIGTSDFALSEYTCCDTPGIQNFALHHEDTQYIIPILKEILAINPAVKIISAPWTAPLWMKTNGNWTSGNLKREYYQDYATYFVKWIQAFRSHGIDIYGVTPQNEPLNRGNSASMFMGWDEQRDFVKTALGPAFRRAGITTKIYAYDHNYNYDNMSDQQHYPTKIYADAEAAQYFAGSAYHNYGGDASEMSYVHNANPDKELIFTEWTAGTWSWPGVGINAVTTDAKALIFNVIKNWGRGALVWNLMLDSDRGPYRPGGCSTGNGAIDISKSDYSSLTYNSFYYVMCIAASAVSDGAHYITANGGANGIDCVAFRNTDGGYGMVLLNDSDATRTILISDGADRFTATIPAKSLASYRW